jgi:dTDP-4-dehydrorhamnose 3,5-epimerase
MQVRTTPLEGVLIIEPDIFTDERGAFVEVWSEARYRAAGIPCSFVQDNVSWSAGGVLRGLHLQHPRSQGKLVQVVEGEVFDVAVDVRPDSPDFGRWVGSPLSAATRRQLWIPHGFAHGFCVLSDRAVVLYKCTDYYDRASELGIIWNDPEIGIEWPVASPTLSAKDAALPRLADIVEQRLPKRQGGDVLPLSSS